MSAAAELDHGVSEWAERLGAQSLAVEAIRSLRSFGDRELVVDHTMERKAITARQLLFISLVLSRELRKRSDERIGIVLPPGPGAFIANLACLFADKVPVNLNFTAGTAAIESSMKRAGITHVITAGIVQSRLKDFPWPDDLLDIARWIKECPKSRLLRWMLATRLPTGLLLQLAGPFRRAGGDEATLLFTSGSSGEPKAVVLTHANIIGNCRQIVDAEVLSAEDTLMACLPIFHSFGFTVTLCFPALVGLRVVTLPSPLDVGKIAETIQAEKVSVHVGTPTFFRAYFRKAKPEQLASLRAVVAGAEKTPEGFHDRWEKTFGSRYLEGYGLTETAPVVSCNLPTETGTRQGSVGRLFPGMAVRTHDPEDGSLRGRGESGLLAFRGINVFGGYLGLEEATREVLSEDGWFRTGDLGRVDEDGFLYIEGRLSRFSKVGGEMVPHGTVEEVLVSELGLEGEKGPLVAVTARRDEAKGERIVLVCACELVQEDVRKALEKRGLPNLWVPREIIRVEAVPMLPSGKLDLRSLREIAEKGP